LGKLLVRLGDVLFVRERRRGRGIPSARLERHTGMRLPPGTLIVLGAMDDRPGTS
jgi:hypothetical protein